MFLGPSYGRPYNYLGRPRHDTEVERLTEEEQDNYIARVLKENNHKKELIDFSNPTKN